MRTKQSHHVVPGKHAGKKWSEQSEQTTASDERDDPGSGRTAAAETAGFSEDQLRAITSIVRRLLNEEFSAGRHHPREESRGDDSHGSSKSCGNSRKGGEAGAAACPLARRRGTGGSVRGGGGGGSGKGGAADAQVSCPHQFRQGEGASNPFSALLPSMTSISTTTDKKDSSEPKATRYLVAKGLPTLTMRVVERIWNLEFVEMEDLLPAPRSLCLAEQGTSPKSLQDSLVGFESLPGPPATQGAAQGNRHHNVGQMLYGSALQEGTSYGPQHGGPPAYSPAPQPEGYPTLRLAEIRRPVLDGAGSLRKQGLEGRGSVACLPGQRHPFDTPDGEAPPPPPPPPPREKGKGKREEGHGT